MQRMAKERERETGRRRIERQGRGQRGRRGRRKGGGRGCEMCAGGREDGKGVLGNEGGDNTMCRGRAATVLRMCWGCCVCLAEVGAGKRARERERRDGGGEA
ncbi:hypothetical protein AAC387_Pa03g4305 [Persea americana]